LNFVAQELKPKEKIYLVNKLHASCRLSHSAHVKTLRKTIIITKEKKYQRRFFGLPGAVVSSLSGAKDWCRHFFRNEQQRSKKRSPNQTLNKIFCKLFQNFFFNLRALNFKEKNQALSSKL